MLGLRLHRDGFYLSAGAPLANRLEASTPKARATCYEEAGPPAGPHACPDRKPRPAGSPDSSGSSAPPRPASLEHAPHGARAGHSGASGPLAELSTAGRRRTLSNLTPRSGWLCRQFLPELFVSAPGSRIRNSPTVRTETSKPPPRACVVGWPEELAARWAPLPTETGRRARLRHTRTFRRGRLPTGLVEPSVGRLESVLPPTIPGMEGGSTNSL